MDDVGKTIKNIIFRKVKPGQIVVHTPKEFSDANMKFVSSIITVYLPKLDEIIEPESIHQVPSIPKTFLIHKLVRWQRRLQYRIFQDGGLCCHEKSNKGDSECSTREEWYIEDGSE